MSQSATTGVLKGETLIYVKSGNQSVLLTTEEVVFSNANHLSYSILLSDITDIFPINIKETVLGFVSQSSSGDEVVNIPLNSNYFKVKADHVNFYSQGKSNVWGKTEMIFKISPAISHYLLNLKAS